MGARQSRRSVDITTTPKKEGIPAEGGDATAPGDGKLERIEEADTKPTTNGIAPHTDVTEDKDKDKDDATEKEKDKEKPEEVKAEETKQEPAVESPAETTEVTTPTEATPASPNTATSPDSKETKKKEKMKKKWSFRSISFSKKDKNKPAREEAPKNGDVTKEEPLAEGGEEAENGSTTAGSPVEEKSTASSPTAETESAPVAAAAAAAAAAAPASTPADPASAAPATETPPASEPAATEVKEESPASAPSKPAVEKTEEPAPSVPTPVPVEDKKEESEKVQAEKKVVEVSPDGGQFVPDPVEVSVFRVQTVATPSIIERKTSEDIPSLPPSSPPPTPIDSSPLQRAQQAAETATALAKALSLPAEAADKDLITQPALSSLCPELDDPSTPVAVSLESNPQKQPSPSTDETPRTEPTVVPSSVETRPTSAIDTESSSTPVASITENLESLSCGDGKNTVEASSSLPITECAASSPFDVPCMPESSLSESSAGQERVTDVPRAAEGDLVVMSLEMKIDEKIDEMIEPPLSDIVSQTADLVERSSVPLDTIHDASCSSPVENRGGSDPAVSEGAVKEASTECAGKEVQELVDPNEVTPEEVERVEEEAVIDPITSATVMVVDSEEGPMPVSDETLVEAKPAVVIPEDEETVDTDADVSRVDTKVEDELETVVKSNIVEPMEEVAASEEPVKAQDSPVSNVTTECTTKSITVEGAPEATEIEEESMPPPLPESPVPSLQEKFDSENANVVNDSITVPSPVVDAVPQLIDVENTNKVDEPPLSGQQIETPKECPVMDAPALPADEPSTQILDSSSCHESELPSRISSCTLEHARDPTDDLPPGSEDTVQRIDSSNCPLPSENPSCPLNASETKNEVPVPDENVPSLRTPTETLLTPPRSPSPQSNVSITSALTTSTKDSSQTHLYDDQSNREFKMESVSISLNSYNESDIELRERLAESLAETEKQEESSVSCQLSNNATSPTTVQETHQSTPENETPVENNVAHDSTTESSDETSKVTPPAVPSETPASPPSAPAITEDVASVAKAIEEMDINDKIAASATILYNTNEIIVDAHYQNNINE